MPFTLSHPAAVLPLLRPPFSRTALVAGAVAPDLPYVVVATGLPVSAQSWYEPFVNATTTHGASGAVTVTLPYALSLCGLVRAGRRPLASLLPVPVAPSRPRTAGTLVRRAGWIVLSALIGIATHLVWDAFTHHDGFVVTRAPWLNSTLVGGLTWARALQHASTIGGLAAIAVYAWRRRARREGQGRARPDSATRRPVLLAMALVAVVGAVAHAWWWLAGPEAVATGLPLGIVIEGVLSDAAKGAGAGLIGGLTLYVVVWWIRRAVTATRPRRSGVGSGYEDAPRANSAA
ncbi:hypothetical protein P3T27_007617 [Kitasatospora sp. MAA19]|uniref:DUF4184 family protein n=1 Tax=Kitasatospora sp. MAA19 TaxID=3035090 RepID=UPI002473465D|nr:DUF4184 family protein [Kitasatospora sp. MAA19]MDH6710866.1 hypothetical protein [Kitasatospora sp. MAA19]